MSRCRPTATWREEPKSRLSLPRISWGTCGLAQSAINRCRSIPRPFVPALVRQHAYRGRDGILEAHLMAVGNQQLAGVVWTLACDQLLVVGLDVPSQASIGDRSFARQTGEGNTHVEPARETRRLFQTCVVSHNFEAPLWLAMACRLWRWGLDYSRWVGRGVDRTARELKNRQTD